MCNLESDNDSLEESTSELSKRADEIVAKLKVHYNPVARFLKRGGHIRCRSGYFSLLAFDS